MDILSKFPERLSELMFEKGLTVKELSAQSGIGANTLYRYLNGERLPAFNYFVKLLEFFNCSADFLLGRIEFSPENPFFYPVPPFQKRFRQVLDEYKMSQYRLHQITHFSYDNFNSWLKGKSSPYADNLIKLATAFGCSVDYLIGRVR